MSTNAQGLNSLATIIKRLEAATSRLEDIALAQTSATNVKQALDAPSGHPPPAPRAPPPPSAPASSAAPAEDSQSVKSFNELVIAGKLEPFLKTAEQIGGPIKEQSDLVGSLFRNLGDLLQCAAASAKPSDATFMSMLGPLQSNITAVNTIKDKYRKERDLGNHFSTLSEGVPAVGWVTISPKPAPYVGEMRDSATFYANRILKDFKDKDQQHIEWARGFLALLDELKKYVMEYHTTGLTWNPKGGDATKFKSTSAAPAAGAPPPPPPPPPAAVPPPPPPAAAPGPLPGVVDTSAVFAQINQGADITKGLRKVNKEEMTHKNPALRASGTVPTASGPGVRRPSKPAKPAALQTKKPPKLELSGTKWSIENYENDPAVVVENTELSHVVNIFNCKNTTIQIKGKINGVVLCKYLFTCFWPNKADDSTSVVNCKKTSVLVESLVASLSITSSPSFTVQITGITPTIQVDNSDSGQIYLSKECLGVEIITAKCSAINVSIPEEGEEDGVFVEKAVPEMLCTTQDAYYQQPQVGRDGRYLGVETVTPLNEPWVGGFQAQGQMPHAQVQGSAPIPSYGPHTGYPDPASRPPTWIPEIKIPGTTYSNYSPYPGQSPHLGPPTSALERASMYIDDHGIWHGAAMVVTADAGSQYDPHPMLHLEWDPLRPVHSTVPGHQRGRSISSIPSPISAISSSSRGLPPPVPYPSEPVITSQKYPPSHAYQQTDAPGHEIWVYRSPSGSFTFWRFLFQIPLGPNEMGVRYRLNMGQELEFFVPGLNQNMRWATYSCNGFSAGINPDDFRGPGHASGYDPLWKDLLDKHAQRPFHALIGGGDQLYCDAMMREPELQGFLGLKTAKEKIAAPLTDDILSALDRHYCLEFRRGMFAKANSSIPMVNMLDDHDLIDGFGSYPDNLQSSPIFKTTMLESKLNPFTALAQNGSLGLSNFVNKFNKDPELLDDLNDHWTAKSHKASLSRERNWFIEQVQAFSKARRIRVTFLSGDVHCAAVGYFKTLARGGGKAPAIDPLGDHRYMLNVVTSAIVNTPPPAGVLTTVGMLASRPHKTMHYCDTDESMIPLFRTDTDGTSLKQPYIMGRRNYTSVELDEQTGYLNFDIRIEKAKGVGETVGYLVQAPPPSWV
ncbi:unnamed protein product [Rhizoctonia solani]|uniref:Adenylyl cyclase-associated protein n=1 Tax=Rhizoctonia solani TaxID=456999 RepID=A0A8H3EB53_9AGAM|nr:unnamed protein product [Rhizoctonia solani]